MSISSLPLNFDISKYNFSQYEWYSPTFVMNMFFDLCEYYPNAEDHYLFKKAVEAVQGVIGLLGARALHPDNVYVMQMNRQSQRPDVIAATHTTVNGVPTIKTTPMEITGMEAHTEHIDIATFLLKKLNKVPPYPDETIFVCVVNKVLDYNVHDIATKIKPANKKNAVYIAGKRKDHIPSSFFIASPQPIIAKTPFDIGQQGNNYPFPERIMFEKDMVNMNPAFIPIPARPIDLFDFFMLDKARIEEKFGKIRQR